MQPSSVVSAWGGDAPLVGLPRPLCTLTGREQFPACVVTPEHPADILDELPLAIELAAARCRIMAPHELRLRVQDAVGVLAGNSPAADTSRYPTPAFPAPCPTHGG